MFLKTIFFCASYRGFLPFCDVSWTRRQTCSSTGDFPPFLPRPLCRLKGFYIYFLLFRISMFFFPGAVALFLRPIFAIFSALWPLSRSLICLRRFWLYVSANYNHVGYDFWHFSSDPSNGIRSHSSIYLWTTVINDCFWSELRARKAFIVGSIINYIYTIFRLLFVEFIGSCD